MSSELASSPVREASAPFWTRRVRWTQVRINAAWWLQSLLPALFVATLALVILVLAGRRAGWPGRVLESGALAAIGIALAASYFLARRHFVSLAEARAHVESVLALRSRLSAAAAGICTWPPRGEWRAGVVRWNWPRLVGPPALCAGLLGAAFWIPISRPEPVAPLPIAMPPALATATEWLDALEKSEAIDPASLEQPREQAEQLGDQDPAEWYSHASLEAADHLRAKLQAGMRALDQNAAAIDSALSAASASALSDAQAAALADQIGGALDAMTGNIPGLDRALAEKLREIDPAKLRQISPEQLRSMRDRLQKARGECRECLGEGKPREGEGEEGRTGNGGVQRGPGTAPITLSREPTDLKTDRTDTLESEDFSRAAMGDRAGVSAGAHEVDRAAGHRAASGGAAAQGAGANAVWLQQNVSPEERRRLREFFK
jgi:hypothetical protein